MCRNNGFKLLLYDTCEKGLLQAHHGNFGTLVKLLNIYFCYLNLFNHG